MTEPESLPESPPNQAAHAQPVSKGSDAWAAGISDGPADFSEPADAAAKPAPIQSELPPTSRAPLTPTAQPVPAAPVRELEARPITSAEKRGPTIEVAGAARVEPVGARRVESDASIPAANTSSASASSASQSAPASAAGPSVPPPHEIPPPITPIAPAAATGSHARPVRRIWAVLAHLAYLVPLPAHFAGIVISTLIWVWKRNSDPLVEDQGRESLNFQLTYLALSAAASITCIGCVFVPVLWIIGAVLCIVAAVRANDGEKFRYPYIFRLIA